MANVNDMNPASLLVGFQPLADGLKYRHITEIMVYAYVSNLGTGFFSPIFATLQAGFTESTVTYSSQPRHDLYSFGSSLQSSGYSSLSLTDSWLLKYGLWISSYYYWPCTVDTSRSSNKPYLIVSYDDTDVTPTVTASPTSGYVPKHASSVFSWVMGKSGTSYSDFTQASATYRWRTAEGATPTEIACGTNTSITIPANTFSTGSIQWQVTLITNTGASVTSPWYTMSTVEATSTPVIVAPKSTVLDGSKDTVFSWQHIISTGTAQTKYDLYTSADGTNYSQLKSESTAATSTTITAGTLVAGSLYWKVRTYNTDNAAGAWSDIGQLAVVAAPATPSVTVVASPRPLVQWQIEGQQGYEVTIGDYNSGLIFGTDKSFKSPLFLADGVYAVKVRVQNKYGLWSDYGTASVSVTNTPGDAITLTVTASHIATLAWDTTGSYDKYFVYRDGEVITETTDKHYTDNTSIGSVSYFVRGAHNSNDNYTSSNAQTVEIDTETLMIADLDTGVWYTLALSDTQDRKNGISESQQVAYMNFVGDTYPSVEQSEFVDKSFNFVVAFEKSTEAKQFEALRGKTVCVKGKGDMVIGKLSAFSKSASGFYFAYSCSVKQIEWR